MDSTPEETRLRPHPAERFGKPIKLLDLPAEIRRLRAEAAPVRHGHRQIALDRHGPVTLVLFAFEEGGSLRDHRADGVVVIHALEGNLVVRAEGEEYELRSDMAVMLAPGVPHSVEARQASTMLLTVCLVGGE
jgi:quercetin dioxygenase-like cupin family protein